MPSSVDRFQRGTNLIALFERAVPPPPQESRPATGDAEGESEQQAIDNFPGLLKATVMTPSHHGASTEGSNSQVWADTTVPEVLISSAGNRFFHPRCTATNRFTTLAFTKEHEVRCGDSESYTNSRTDLAHYVTAVSGAIIVTTNGRSPVALHCTGSAECGVRIRIDVVCKLATPRAPTHRVRNRAGQAVPVCPRAGGKVTTGG